jgi:hypothetical protein
MRNTSFENRAYCSSNFKKKHYQKVQRVINFTIKKHRRMIIEDSHARNCAAELQKIV